MSWLSDYLKFNNMMVSAVNNTLSGAELSLLSFKEPIFDYSNSVTLGDNFLSETSNVKSVDSLPEAICSKSIRDSLNNFFSRNMLGDYDWPLLKDNVSAIKSSQKHLLGLIKYYEDDRLCLFTFLVKGDN